jgi:hypothetical protein
MDFVGWTTFLNPGSGRTISGDGSLGKPGRAEGVKKARAATLFVRRCPGCATNA